MGVIYYMELTLTLPSPLREHFPLFRRRVPFLVRGHRVRGSPEDRTLSRVVRSLHRGEAVAVSDAALAGRERRRSSIGNTCSRPGGYPSPAGSGHALLEGLRRRFDDGVDHLTISVFIAISMTLMSTYFMLEYCMRPVLRYLLDRALRSISRRSRAASCECGSAISFALIILVTALMIGTLARQRATDIIASPQNRKRGSEACARIRSGSPSSRSGSASCTPPF